MSTTAGMGDGDAAVETPEDDRARLQALLERHVGRLLLQAHRAFSAHAVAKLHARGYPGLTLAHIGSLPHLEMEGTRITTLAERVGITKQGMGSLIRDLERQGFVARVMDPSDRRATLVHLTDAGLRFMRDAIAVTRELEADYAALLGPAHLDALRAILIRLVEQDHHPT